MRMTAQADYALRLLMYLGLAGTRRVTIDDVAQAYGISKNHLMKIANRLVREGAVSSRRGRHGGLTLACDPSDISIGRLVRAFEAETALVECFDAAATRCVITPACRLRTALAAALEAYYSSLDRVSLGDLIGNREQLEGLLGIERP